MPVVTASLYFLSVYGFNVVTQLWSDLPRFSKDRGYHGIASFGGQLVVTGGYSNINSETLDLGIKLHSAKPQRRYGICVCDNRVCKPNQTSCDSLNLSPTDWKGRLKLQEPLFGNLTAMQF